MAVSPEHISHASDEEVRPWLVTVQEADLIDTYVAAGGGGFVDLRGRPTPPDTGSTEFVAPAPAAAQPPPRTPMNSMPEVPVMQAPAAATTEAAPTVSTPGPLAPRPSRRVDVDPMSAPVGAMGMQKI